MSDPRTVLLVGADLMARARVDEAARRAGHAVRSVTADGLRDALEAEDVAVVVVDLDRAGVDALEMLPGPPARRMVGFYSHIDADLGRRAETAGCEAIPRGRFWRTLPELLASL